MLFDLRGRGRRRTVKVIYIGLAVLIGVGLVGFGVGGGFGGGGLLNAAENNGGAGSASFASQIAKYRKLTQQQPNNVSAWEALIKAELHEAGGEAYVSNGQVTSKGKELFTETAGSWRSYLALNPPKPNVELAQLMVRVFGLEGLNDPAATVQVLQLVVAARPTSGALYAALAQYAYLAHNTRLGDLASAKAISLVSPAQRPRLKLELAQARKGPTGRESSSATANPEASSKAYTAIPTTSTQAPAGTSTGTKK
jgi:hypothetical protein